MVVQAPLPGPVPDVGLEPPEHGQEGATVMPEMPLADHAAPESQSGSEKLRQDFQVVRKSVRRHGFDDPALKTWPVKPQRVEIS